MDGVSWATTLSPSRYCPPPLPLIIHLPPDLLASKAQRLGKAVHDLAAGPPGSDEEARDSLWGKDAGDQEVGVQVRGEGRGRRGEGQGWVVGDLMVMRQLLMQDCAVEGLCAKRVRGSSVVM